MSDANREVEPIEKAWNELNALVQSLNAGDLEITGSGIWAVKDHLVHIGAWERSLLALLDGEDRKAAMGASEASDETDSINEAVWLSHRAESPEQALAYARESHAALMKRLGGMSDADLRRSYNHYQPNDPRDPGDDRPVVDWVAGNTYEHYAEHLVWINQIIESSAAR
jgi:hypothetical protein